jgi:hypothetical protein
MYQTHILITHLYNLKLIDLPQLLNTIYLHRVSEWVSEGVQILSESAMFQKYLTTFWLDIDAVPVRGYTYPSSWKYYVDYKPTNIWT